jgi:hypothetical protein
VGVQTPGSLSGAPGGGVPGVTITNVRVEDVDLGGGEWRCQNVTGTSNNVIPRPCKEIGG